jgi:hypothetical protein
MSSFWRGAVTADHGMSQIMQRRCPDVEKPVDNLTVSDHAGAIGVSAAGAGA